VFSTGHPPDGGRTSQPLHEACSQLRALCLPRERNIPCNGAPSVRALLVSIVSFVACGSSLPRPPRGEPPPGAYAEVPYPPPPAQVERVPERPERAVWVDGSWLWTGTRWRWRDGGWFEPPPQGVVYADWEIRRPSGTSLRFAGAAWRDRSGAEVSPPRLVASATMAPPSDAGAGLDGAADASAAVDASPADAAPFDGGIDAGELDATPLADGAAPTTGNR
jgi:hypothetical protein